MLLLKRCFVMNLKESRLPKSGQLECLRVESVVRRSPDVVSPVLLVVGPILWSDLVPKPSVSLFGPFLDFFGRFVNLESRTSMGSCKWWPSGSSFCSPNFGPWQVGPTRHHSNQPDHSKYHDLREASWLDARKTCREMSAS